MTMGFYVLLVFDIFLVLSNVSEVKCQRKNQVYIVYMGASSSTTIKHAQLLSELVKRNKNSILHKYHKSFLGFAARLSEEEAKSIARRPGVVSVFSDSVSKLHTTNSWDFLMRQTAFHENVAVAPSRSNSSTRRDTIIGFIDTGICPQHESFNDTYIGPIPKHWKGICMTGDNSTWFKCNRKVIGARYYVDPEYPDSMTSPMDMHGHGTHVASTAAGVPVYGASYYGLAEGVARGGSPNSRIAAYRVCGDYGCADSAILKGFDDAIADGVDVISVSMGAPIFDTYITDIMTIGAFHAMENGVAVVAAAGNEGPSPETILNFSPWFLTVAATTIDRDFQVDIVLGNGNNDVVIKGGGISFPLHNESTFYPIVEGRSAGYKYNEHDLTNATYCEVGSLDINKVKGKIVLCNNNNSVEIYYKVGAMIKQGVIGIIMIDNYTSRVNYVIQFAAVNEANGAQIQSYIRSTRNPLAKILQTKTIYNYKPAPVVPLFSSRGPIPEIKNLLKPDVTAPGVAILAAWRFNGTDRAFPGKEPPIFVPVTGTSMSTPHVSGLAALIKSWHPTWTPSTIKSAIMTTAIPTNNENVPITTITGSKATPYEIGSGEISLVNPLCPGLVYETQTIDYIIFLCNLGYNTSMIKLMSRTIPSNYSCPSNSSPAMISNLNYPSIVVSELMTHVKKTVIRTVTNVGQDYSTYTVTVEAPAEVHVQVVPNKLRFTKKLKKLSFQVTFLLTTTPLSESNFFGSFTWSDNFHHVRSPFVAISA